MYAAAFRRALLLTGHRQSAEDAAQEAIARLLGQAPGRVLNPGAWVSRVVSRLSYDWLRKRGREISVAEPPEPELQSAGSAALAADPATEVVARAEQNQVRAALAQLSPRDRTLLLLRHSGSSYQDIARALGCAPTSVGTLLVRAERRFKACYEQLEKGSSQRR